MTELLQEITALSHEFGGPDDVKGGGGNTSAKVAETIWVKPSGTTLNSLTPQTFIAMDRQRLSRLYELVMPREMHAREARVMEYMTAAVREAQAGGRPSVEAPLHDILNPTFVVHTHAVFVNGMTCAQDGAATSARLFPEALWVPYTDPGYTLCMDVRSRVRDYQAHHGRQPAVIMLDNHGIFVAGNTGDEIRNLYRHVIDTLKIEYRQAGISTALSIGPAPDERRANDVRRTLQELLGADAVATVASGKFAVARDAISPDHIVYSKSAPYEGAITRQGLDAYRQKFGNWPRVFVAADAVYATGPSAKTAGLAMELAQDGALLQQLAAAFGGIKFLSDPARRFIEEWEVEAYRQKQVK